jgi:hypothetical protein
MGSLGAAPVNASALPVGIAVPAGEIDGETSLLLPYMAPEPELEGKADPMVVPIP